MLIVFFWIVVKGYKMSLTRHKLMLTKKESPRLKTKLSDELQIKATHIHEKSKMSLTLSEIFAFYVVYDT